MGLSPVLLVAARHFSAYGLEIVTELGRANGARQLIRGALFLPRLSAGLPSSHPPMYLG